MDNAGESVSVTVASIIARIKAKNMRAQEALKINQRSLEENLSYLSPEQKALLMKNGRDSPNKEI